MEQIAGEASVSRATAYRYFPNVESLLVEAPIDELVPPADHLFSGPEAPSDPVERVLRVESLLHGVSYRNQTPLRLMMAASLQRAAHPPEASAVPVRQNRRTPLLHAALAPVRTRMSKRTYEQLCASLAVFCGPESMVVFQDVLGISERAAQQAKRWAVKALVQAALDQAGDRDGAE